MEAVLVIAFVFLVILGLAFVLRRRGTTHAPGAKVYDHGDKAYGVWYKSDGRDRK